MRSNPNNPSKKKPSMFQPLPKTQPFSSLANGEDDDDDFQDPISLTHPSLRKVVSSQPLKPCNAARPKKRSRLVGSSGKENSEIHQISENASQVSHILHRALDSSVSCFFSDGFDKKQENKSLPVVAEALDRSSRICCSLSEFSVSEAPETGVGSPSFLEFNETVDELGEFTSIGAKKLEYDGNREVEFENPDESYVTPTESMLAESKFGMHNGEAGESFELGTQLNELMDLCSEWDSQQDFNFIREHGSVECPLCGHDLSDLSEALRQLHTNDCLDRGDTRETPDSTCNEQASLKGQNVDMIPVIELLRDLNLSRYEEIFIREEIDLESLQWLKEEVPLYQEFRLRYYYNPVGKCNLQVSNPNLNSKGSSSCNLEHAEGEENSQGARRISHSHWGYENDSGAERLSNEKKHSGGAEHSGDGTRIARELNESRGLGKLKATRTLDIKPEVTRKDCSG